MNFIEFLNIWRYENIENPDYLFKMSNLRENKTGLPVNIYVSSGGSVNKRHGPRLKVMISSAEKFNPSETVSVCLKKDITTDDVIGYHQLFPELLEKLREYVNLNYDVLMLYWNDEIDTDDLVNRLRKIKVKENCACGFILAEPRGWLLCHPTNGGNRWDFPKGWAESGEDHLEAAKRELFEETGLILQKDLSEVIDLGQHPYQDHRDLHLFYKRLTKIDTRGMNCISMVDNSPDKDYPEMDAFAVFPIEKAILKLGIRLQHWI